MRLTIKQKLIGLSLIAIVMLAAVGMIAHFSLNSTFSTIKAMQSTAQSLRNHLESDMMHDALRGDVLAAFLANTEEERKTVRDDLSEHATVFREKLTENLNSPLDAKTLAALREAQPVLEKYIASAETIIDLAFKDRVKAEALRPEFNQAFGDLEGQMESLSDLIETGATAAVSHAEQNITARETTIMMLGIAAVIGLSSLAWWIIRSIMMPLDRCVSVFGQVAAGDLTQRVANRSTDELGVMSRSFDGLVQNMHEIVTKINIMSQEVAAAATEIAASAQEMATGMDGQNQQVSQVSASVEEMTASISDVADKSNEMAKTAEESGRVAVDGGKVVQQTIEGMTAINEAVSQGAASVEELGRRSEQIGKIIEVIDDIADQTNLLALNAAIEAARAGEHGRGFAVVADEVRKLAERTTTATKEVTDSVRAIQEQTINAVQGMKTGSQRVTTGVALAHQAGDSLRSIVERASQVATMVQSIAAAAAQQSASSTQIASAIQTVNEVTRETTEATNQAASAATALSQKAEELQALVGRFKLEDSSKAQVAVMQSKRSSHRRAA